MACLVALFLATANGQEARAGAGGIDLRDQELFPAEFFPNLKEVSEDEVLLAGLQNLYPNRILTESPDPDLGEPVPPTVRALGGSGTYIRVKHLSAALPVIAEHLNGNKAYLVIDFRFLTTDFSSTAELGALLTRQNRLTLTRAGNFPVDSQFLNGQAITIQGSGYRRTDQAVFTLSNHETRGPIEALLAQLKEDAEVISVGASSAGQTASFRPFPGFDSYYLINGDLRPASGESLVETGFVPRVHTRVAPEEDRLAYLSLRDDVEIEALVKTRSSRQRSPNQPAALSPPRENGVLEEEQQDFPQDIILQRTLNIVKALQALGHIPN